MDKVKLGNKEYPFVIWNDKLPGPSGQLVAIDTETEVIDDPSRIPRLSIVSAFDGVMAYILEAKKARAFLERLTPNQHLVFFNIPFDFWVIDEHLKGPLCATGSPLWNFVDNNLAHDAMFLDMLYRLALSDEYPSPRNLGVVANVYGKIEVDKEDPYRMRYGEIIGEDLTKVERGFVDYGVKDPIATYIAFINLFKKAKELALRAGVSVETLKEHGVLTEAIQIKGALALSKITKNGICLNKALARDMQGDMLASINLLFKELDTEYPNLFKRHKKTKEIEYTDNDVPKVGRKVLVEIFEKVAKDMGNIKVPLTATGKVSTSMVLWGDWVEHDKFLTKWDNWTEQTKAVQFFKKLLYDKVNPRYNYFVRTGRTSQQQPNCLHKDTELLTPNGWKRVEELYDTKTPIMQWDGHGNMSFVEPLYWVKQKTNLLVCGRSSRVEFKVTIDHRMIYRDRKDQIKERVAGDFSREGYAICSGNYVTEPYPISNNLLRLVNIYLCYGRVDNNDKVVFRTMKYKALVKGILDLEGITYFGKKTEIVCEKEDLANLLELVDGTWPFKLNYKQLRRVLRIKPSLRGYIANKDNFILANFLAGKIINRVGSICKRSPEICRITYKLEQLDEDVYCPGVPSSYIVMRFNGKISVTGNCQQIKKGKMREIIVPSEGCYLVSIDYSYIELRTLARVLEKMYKKSVLADVIRSGKDPHAWTGAMLIGMEYDDFLKLKKTDSDKYDEWRQNAKACFHKDTEILTDIGWKKVNEISLEDNVAQYWEDTEEIEFVKPVRTVEVDGKDLYRVHSLHHDLIVTEDHQMFCLNWNEKPIKCLPHQFPKKCRKSVHAGYKQSGTSDDTLNIRRAVAIQADGSFNEQRNAYTFGFKKERKIKRFKELFEGIIEYEHFDIKTGVTRFKVERNLDFDIYLTEEKTFNTKVLLDASFDIRKAFIDELAYWDGTHLSKEGNFSLTSVNLDVIKTIQAICAITGYRTVFNEWITNLSTNPAYSLGIVLNNTARPSKMFCEKVASNEKAYCLTVPSGLLVTRFGKSVQICGNCNFGIPGGLGATKLFNYAKNVYGIKTWTPEIAADFRRKITEQVYPEMGRYLEEDTMAILCTNLNCCVEDAWRAFEIKGERSPGILSAVRNIVGGSLIKKDGTKYNDYFVQTTWDKLNSLNNNLTLSSELSKRVGNIGLMRMLFWDQVQTLTGRIRGRVSYSQLRNTPFQGLAVDGAKLALWRLTKEGFRIVNFVHDELVFEIPKPVKKDIVDYLLKVMCEEMEKVTPNIPIQGEYLVADCWKKKGKMRVEDGIIIPC